MSDYDDLKEELTKLRDEIQLKMHLASMDMKDEWAGLEKQWGDFASKARVHESSEGIGNALDSLGVELKAAYHRFKDAL